MRIALIQFNPIVGDLAGNTARMIDMAHTASEGGADLVVFPELSVVGYPPMDLLERRSFVDAIEDAVAWALPRFPAGTGILFGVPVRNGAVVGKPLTNAAVLAEDGRVLATVAKRQLPTYDVFDESRYFKPATTCTPVEWRGLRLGIHVCEDMWKTAPSFAAHRYASTPVDDLGDQGVDLFINISASPFALGKVEERDAIVVDYCQRHGQPFIYVNQVGANTEIVFDGSSGAFGADGALQTSMGSFTEGVGYWDGDFGWSEREERDDTDDLLDALLLGVHDYVEKTGIFNRVVVGLSGGIDSAVTCALAVSALGPARVLGLTMPSAYSSRGSIVDSIELAENLGIEIHQISIEPAVDSFTGMLSEMFAGSAMGVAEENIQARVRGVTLMAVCNKFNHLLLTTGNKSELATGYATLYGDMSGGLAVLSDVFKTQVYELAHRINARTGKTVIPENTITKPPSAELRPDQKDTDSLPPYDQLDTILELYVEDGLDADEIVAETSIESGIVERVVAMVDRNEYKRRQAAPGIRVSKKAFGIGRRMPIVMRLSEVKPEMAEQR